MDEFPDMPTIPEQFYKRMEWLNAAGIPTTAMGSYHLNVATIKRSGKRRMGIAHRAVLLLSEPGVNFYQEDTRRNVYVRLVTAQWGQIQRIGPLTKRLREGSDHRVSLRVGEGKEIEISAGKKLSDDHRAVLDVLGEGDFNDLPEAAQRDARMSRIRMTSKRLEEQ